MFAGKTNISINMTSIAVQPVCGKPSCPRNQDDVFSLNIMIKKAWLTTVTEGLFHLQIYKKYAFPLLLKVV